MSADVSHALPQANGAKQYMTVGIVFQRALLITTSIAAVLVLPLWLNVGRILTHFGELLDTCITSSGLWARIWLVC